MKKLIYIFSFLAILFTGCQTNEIVLEEPTLENGKRTITFSMDVPEFQVKSRAESATPITDIQLMTFGENGYIETVRATNINNIKEEGKTPVGTFSAAIDRTTTVVHFIANYDGDLSATSGADEDAVIPNLKASTESIVYWARNEISFDDTSIYVNFLRHVAKVTVEVSNEVIDGYAANSYFQVTGFTICQYVAEGTIAPKNYEWGYKTNSDGTIEEDPTEIVGIGTTTPETFPTTKPDELYLAECSNQKVQEDQVYVIIAGQLKPKNDNDEWNTTAAWGDTKYYKVLLTDIHDNPFKIIRNVNYRVVIKQMQDVGAVSFEEAKSSNPINNLYAYVMAESPSISDMDGYTLTVTPIVHLLTAAGSFESTVTTINPPSGTARTLAFSEPQGDNILSNISLNNGKLTADVAAVGELKKAQIRVTYGKLSRTVTVIASPQFTIEAQTYSDEECTVVKSSYSNANESVYFKFNLDSDYPSATEYPDLYPIKCYIRADNLYPVDNKDMLIDYEYKEGQYWYTFLAKRTGDHVIHFKTKLSTVDEKIEIESAYFGSDAVELTGKEETKISVKYNNSEIQSLTFSNYSTYRDITIAVSPEQTITLTFQNNRYTATNRGNGVYRISHRNGYQWSDVLTITAQDGTTKTINLSNN